MGRLDDELQQAVSEAEASVSDSGPASGAGDVGGTVAAPPPERRRRLGLVLALGLMGAAILVLVLSSFEEAAIYSKGVDQLIAERDRLQTRNVRVDGILVGGTLLRRDQPCEYRFAMTKNGARVDVRYPRCVVPDTFRDLPGSQVEVTVEGRLTQAGYLEADRILAKCPSRYEMDQRVSGGEQRPHAEAASSVGAGAN
jgi:cytochrome c-type biogenesis protein CcmE